MSKKNPNLLPGHEGKLLQVLGRTKWPGRQEDDESLPQRGDVVMYVQLEEDSYGNGWVEVIHNEKVVRLFIEPRKWLWYFVPWPHGAFIGE